MSDAKLFYDLKERAKWSRDVEEKKAAIKQLSSLGEKALPSLEEILSVTAYEDIKATCLDAIKSIKEGKEKEAAVVMDKQPSASTASAAATATADDVKKKEQEKAAEGGEASKARPKLADLPP
ncbi:hypothetical protein [Nitrososphaera viennensis]|uniref:Uncharacterized protein n=1 Tax=Nitrososphaera viennensis TaxID=1034015 RepID=A0A977IC37_9ARCH|nr:hypothetical protein [Nitrososphaera viennensis]UVS68037.1 hypothetical protein NWT39_08990 [Nitrososphaera viennensis]